jgi:hypothetical protein
MSDKKMVKDDINFLEYPNWTLSKKKNTQVYTIQREHGTYQMLSHLGLPKHFDKVVVYCLLNMLYREKKPGSTSVTTTRYAMAKDIFDKNRNGQNIYDRIMESLELWQAISIHFEGVFYEGAGHTVRYFSIIDECVLNKETGELVVRFSESYINQLDNSKYYKLIDFEQYKLIRRPTAARLYEILVKTFKGRKEWAIGLQQLAEKLTFEKREGAEKYYPSDVLRHLKPGIAEINQKTDLGIKFDYNKETMVCIFKSVPKEKTAIAKAADERTKRKNEVVMIKKKKLYMEKFDNLIPTEQDNILDAIDKDPFLQFIDGIDSRIYAYMCKNEKYKIA